MILLHFDPLQGTVREDFLLPSIAFALFNFIPS
jgi:hypothetical protein